MRHVKAEHLQHDKDLDDEDDLDLEDDPSRGSELPYHSMHHHHHHHHHHPYASNIHLKDEVLKSDCRGAGVPIPATKPKIWSLADTAACKTPPPSHHQYQLHHQQQQQHYSQQQQQHHHHQQQLQQHHSQQQQQHQHHQQLHQQQHHLGNPQQHSQQPWLGPSGMDSGAQSSGSNLNNFALPSTASMSPSSAATAPYSNNSARYGGFLSSSSGGQLHYNPNSSSGSNSNASSSAAAGFPEVGTDTPPQTPPNMKVATPNGVIQGPPNAYCPGGNPTTPNNINNNNNNNIHYASQHAANYGLTANNNTNNAATFTTRLQNSPHKDFSPATQNTMVHQHQTTASLPPTEATTAFKPFYKG